MPDPTGRISHLPHFHRGVAWKQPVRVATSSNVAPTGISAGNAIDGVTLASGDRVLAKNQTAASSNGIYLAGAAGTWPARAYDMDQDMAYSVPAEEVVGAVVQVTSGSSNASTFWRTTNATAPTLGTTAINWLQAFVSGGGGGVTDHGALTGLADDDHSAYVTVTGGGGETVQNHGAAGATETIDLANGNYHAVTLDADCTFTFTGATNGVECSFTLELTENGTGGWDPTWPGSVVWPGGTAPTHDTTASTTTLYVFTSRDGGTTWYGFQTGSGGGTAGTPALTLSTTNSTGAASTFVATDATVAVFDATVPTTIAYGDAAATGSAGYAARRDHRHGMAAASGGIGELLVADGTVGPNGINPSAIVEMDTERSTTSASLEDITGASLTITTQRAGKVFVTMAFSCYTVSGAAPSTIAFAINVNGTDHQELQRYLSGSTDRGIGAVVHLSDELAAGTHTIKGRFRRVSGVATPGTDELSLVAVAMGHDGPVILTTEDQTDYIYADP